MFFETELVQGEILNIFKNIILDVETQDGLVVPCLCASAGAVPHIAKGQSKVYMSVGDNPLRKIKYEAEIIQEDQALIGANPRINQRLFLEAIENGVIKDFEAYDVIEKITPDSEVRFAHFKLVGEAGQKLYLYIAPVFKKVDDFAVFPTNLDFLEMNVLEEFRQLRADGHATAIVNIVPREDCCQAKFVWNINRIAAAKLFDEAKNGLKIFCYGCKVSTTGIEIDKKLEIV